jgi:hypothetical protein
VRGAQRKQSEKDDESPDVAEYHLSGREAPVGTGEAEGRLSAQSGMLTRKMLCEVANSCAVAPSGRSRRPSNGDVPGKDRNAESG